MPSAAYQRLNRPRRRLHGDIGSSGSRSVEIGVCGVIRSARNLEKPRGREAGEIPAQSRYGDHALGAWKSGRRARGRCSTFERKGRHDAYVRLTTPPVRPEGFRVPTGPSAPIPNRSLTCPPSALRDLRVATPSAALPSAAWPPAAWPQ
jgi:hypothetical protein